MLICYCRSDFCSSCPSSLIFIKFIGELCLLIPTWLFFSNDSYKFLSFVNCYPVLANLFLLMLICFLIHSNSLIINNSIELHFSTGTAHLKYLEFMKKICICLGLWPQSNPDILEAQSLPNLLITELPSSWLSGILVPHTQSCG